MKKILLPTDFSENAFNAAKYAVQLLRDEECIFYLLNTYTPILYDSDFIFNNSSSLSLDEIYHQKSLESLNASIKKLSLEFHNEKHEFESIAEFHHLNQAIKEQVQDKHIDLIVMGTKGATGAEQILFGTHTVHAIKQIECPLLAIPAKFQFKAPLNILFPTDYDINYTPDHLRIFKAIATGNNAEINILHVNFGFSLEPHQQKQRNLLSTFLKETRHQFHEIQEQTVPGGISAFQEAHQSDMIVMISNKHSFFENLLFRPVINEIGFNLKIPLLVIPSGKFNR